MRGQKREQILRVLLAEQHLSKNELSKKAGCTRQWVIRFLHQLEQERLVKGTTIINYRKMFEYWRHLHQKPVKYREYMIRDPLSFLQKIGLEYALTTYQGENLVQRHIFPSRTDFYIKEEDKEKWHELLAKEGLVGGGNVRVLIGDSQVMYGKRKLQKLWVVSLPQLIIDLFTEGAVCVEAAEMLMEKMYHV